MKHTQHRRSDCPINFALEIFGDTWSLLIIRDIVQPHDADKRKERYVLTEKGLNLIPVLVEMGNWSAVYDPQTAAPPDWIALVNADKPGMIRRIRETVRRGGSVFVGPESVLSQVAGAVQAQ